MKKITLIILLAISTMATFAQKGKYKRAVKVLTTGEVFQCDFEKKEEYGIPNMLRVTASKHTDVAIRLINKETDKCIRYAFLNRGDKYEITNIPFGKYYVKVALGEDWFFEDSTGTNKCAGGFKVTPIYKKLNDTFNFKQRKDGSTDSYELQLDIKTDGHKPIKDEYITLKEFQK